MVGRGRSSRWSRYDLDELPRYTSVGARRVQASATAARLKAGGRKLDPVIIEAKGRALAATFWGKAWCDNLEQYSDYANRLPRGRTYARSRAVIHLAIEKGKVSALVQGSELYEIEIDVAAVASKRWAAIVTVCGTEIESVVDLLRGKLPERVIELITRRGAGLFPEPREISFRCSCPDWASMCKHVAAALYGAGARLDRQPELLFALRGVSADDLVARATQGGALTKKKSPPKEKQLARSDLSAIFGIELAGAAKKVAKKRPKK
jgi:uncharacterized Zn finger protein